ncbi:hypothetical protein GCM10010512_46150 [Streptomyces thermoviolaceus subsp. thermoviolaceus]|nr:hypothetical protein GCM10010499_27110 [Streptomyces thermoviolaceus subsp. apingens]GHB09430.1 hypothetical protein GCM10010512_46150 [Streptomyces thermoviolaceus subsp. thermoviolaceus]
MTRQGVGRRGIGDRPLAVRGFGEFVTGHGCLGVVILRWGRQSAAELCPGMVFPSPYPEEYGGTPVKPRSRALSVAVSRSMHDRRPERNGCCLVQVVCGGITCRRGSVTYRFRVRRSTAHRDRVAAGAVPAVTVRSPVVTMRPLLRVRR